MARRRGLLLLVVGALILTSCTDTGGVSATASGSASGSPAVNATTAALLPTTVDALPIMTVDQFHQLLAQLRGTPVVVNVWASWCGPCQAEAPLFRAASARYGDRVQFLGVDILDSQSGAKAFIADHHVPYPSVFDPPGAIRDSLAMIGQPATVFYGRDGTVVKSNDGQIGQSALEAGIKAILG